jgi:hypothetical protein
MEFPLTPMGALCSDQNVFNLQQNNTEYCYSEGEEVQYMDI